MSLPPVIPAAAQFISGYAATFFGYFFYGSRCGCFAYMASTRPFAAFSSFFHNQAGIVACHQADRRLSGISGHPDKREGFEMPVGLQHIGTGRRHPP